MAEALELEQLSTIELIRIARNLLMRQRNNREFSDKREASAKAYMRLPKEQMAAIRRNDATLREWLDEEIPEGEEKSSLGITREIQAAVGILINKEVEIWGK